MRRLAALALLSAGACSSGVIGQGSTGSGTGTHGASSSASTTGAATGSSTSGASSSTGGPAFPYDAGPARCDQAQLTWVGPTSNTDGSCLTDLQSFSIQWGEGPVASPYQYGLDVGLPCWAGASMPCGDGGMAVQLDCAFTVSGLTDGDFYFGVEAVTQFGPSGTTGPVELTIHCGYDGGGAIPCTQGRDCPPYLACFVDGGYCDYASPYAGLYLCDAGSQCAGLGSADVGGIGEGQTCVKGICANGCTSATDCAEYQCCDLSGGSPGKCTSTPTAKCECALDGQCDQLGGQESVCGPSGTCVTGCKTGNDCPSSAACDQSQGFIAKCEAPCVGDRCSCTSSVQCDDGGAGIGVGCLNGLCGPGCQGGADCPSTEACDRTTSLCAANCGVGQQPLGCACKVDSQCQVQGDPLHTYSCSTGLCSACGLKGASCLYDYDCCSMNCDGGTC